ncbi:MAG: hypothetical protein ACRDWN_07155, partial [Acidimicrobiales bacterium]
AELLDPITTVLARRIKRALQDDQNRMLERMRSAAGGWSDDLLPDEQEQRLQYAEAALPEIRQAIAGGIAYSRASLPKSRGRAPVPDDRLVRDVADELAGTLVAALRHRLGGDTDHEAVERVGAAYREWRGERVERLVGDCAVEAFSAGVLAATPGGTALRWARNEASLGCADCEDNVLGGAVDRGREFPTGHRYPPAHPGCRCLVLPTPA